MGVVEDKAMMGGRGKEINSGTKKQTAYLKKVLIQGLIYKIKELCQTNKRGLHWVRQKTLKVSGNICIKCNIQHNSQEDKLSAFLND